MNITTSQNHIRFGAIHVLTHEAAQRLGVDIDQLQAKAKQDPDNDYTDAFISIVKNHTGDSGAEGDGGDIKLYDPRTPRFNHDGFEEIILTNTEHSDTETFDALYQSIQDKNGNTSVEECHQLEVMLYEQAKAEGRLNIIR